MTHKIRCSLVVFFLLVMLILCSLGAIVVFMRHGEGIEAPTGFPPWSLRYVQIDSPRTVAVQTNQLNVDVSVIVLTYHNADNVEHIASVLLNESSPWTTEVLVVDNGCFNETAERIKRMQMHTGLQRLQLIKLCGNRPYSVANNFAVSAVAESSQWVLFLNDDVLPVAGFITGFHAVVEAAAVLQVQVGGVGGKLLFPGGSVIEAGSLIRSDGTTDNFYRSFLYMHFDIIYICTAF